MSGVAVAVGAGTVIAGKMSADSSKAGIKSQERQNARSQDFIEKQASLGRGDINNLYPYGDNARNSSYAEALRLLNDSVQPQMQMYQDGNVAAQQQMIDSIPQYRNAIMGLPMNAQSMTPYKSSMPSPDQYKTQLPSFGSVNTGESDPNSVQYTPPKQGETWADLAYSIAGQQPQQPTQPTSAPQQDQGMSQQQYLNNMALGLAMGTWKRGGR